MIKKVFPVLALSVFSSMLGVGIISPLLPLYAEHLGATGIWIGIIFASFSVSRTVIMPIIARLSDPNGRKVFISIGLLSFSIISLGYIWSSSVLQLTSIRLLHGAAAGMVLPIAQAYVGDIAPAGEEGTWMGYFSASFFSGFGFGPLMGGTLTEHFGMTVAFSTMGGLNLLAFLLVALFLPEVGLKKTATGHRPSFKELSTSATMKGLISFRLAFSIGRGTFAAFLPIFAGIHLILTSTLIGVLSATNILLMSLLQIYGGNIADKLDRRFLVFIGSLTSLVYLVLVPLTQNFWQLLGTCILGGLGGAIALPAASALAVEEGRRFGMGSAMSLISMAFSTGMIIGPLLSGVIADFANVNSVFYSGATIGLVGTTLFVWYTR